MNTTVTAPEVAKKYPNSRPSHSGVSLEPVTITPDVAEEMLKRNKKNRPLSGSHVDELAREMEGGRWKFNAEPIRFDNEGNLIDGQHRLTACVISRMPFTSVVARGLSYDVFDTIDCGKQRNASDVLSMRGEQNSVRLASTLRFVQDYLTESVARKGKYTNTEVEAALQSHPGVRTSVEKLEKYGTKPLMRFSTLAGCHYLFSQYDRKMADDIMEQLMTGLNLAPPIHTLRERLIKARKGSPASNLYVAAIFIKAWNKLRTGDTNPALAFRSGGANPEKFPVIQ